jgi:hypothetical protein
MHDIGTIVWLAVVIIGVIASQVKKLSRSAAPPDTATPAAPAADRPASAETRRNAVLAQRIAAARAAMAAAQPAAAPAPPAPMQQAPPPTAPASPTTGAVQQISLATMPDAPSIADLDRQFALVQPVLPLGLGETDGARRAIVLMEILGPPLALR